MYENESIEDILKDNIKNNKSLLFYLKVFFIITVSLFFLTEKNHFSYLFFSCLFIFEFIFYFVIKSVILDQENILDKVPL